MTRTRPTRTIRQSLFVFVLAVIVVTTQIPVVASGELEPVTVSLDTDRVHPPTSSITAPTPLAQSPSHNPYGKSELIVGIEYATFRSVNYSSRVTDALTFWAENSQIFAGYEVTYELDTEHDEPDILIVFEDNLDTCGSTHNDRIVGCAPLITVSAPDTVEIQIEAGRPYQDMVETIKHEIGHTLGLTHDDEPRVVMRPTA